MLIRQIADPDAEPETGEEQLERRQVHTFRPVEYFSSIPHYL
jgi:hypothetical protein